jgi:hypothetical protein
MERRKTVQEIREAPVNARKIARYKTRHGQNEADLAAATRFAVVLLEVPDRLDTAAKYDSLEADLAGLAGIASAKVMTIGTTPPAADLPPDVTQEIRIRADLHLVSVPVPDLEP